jgi:hypothetical protein
MPREPSYEPTSPTVAAQGLVVLKSLPSFGDTQTRVQAAITQITITASQLIPAISWETSHEGSGGNCERPYEQIVRRPYFLPDTVAANVDVSEANWDKTQQAAKGAAAQLALTGVSVRFDT